MNVKKALTIAGSDSGGGAGIQADLKTFQELEVYGMSAITAVTAQNTLGVQGVYPLSIEAIAQQIDSIGTDLTPDAVKTGMLFNSEMIIIVSEKIREYNWKNLVVDPVMVAKGGESLLLKEAVETLKKYLLPLAKVITPNIPEAEILTGVSIKTKSDRLEAAKRLSNLGVENVVIKGGHDTDEEVVDILYSEDQVYELIGPRFYTKNTHGTGCTFAAAITAELAKGRSIEQAFKTATTFVQNAIEMDLNIGSGHGPTNHWAYRKIKER